MSKITYLFFLFFILVSYSSFNCTQPIDCLKVKNGKFFYFSKLDRRKVTIERIDSLQIEIDPKSAEPLRSKIVWLNDCKMQMFVNAFSQTKLSQEDSLYATKPATIEIIDVRSDFYICLAKFSTSKREYEFRDTMFFQK